jgi:hypothetical protein
MSHVLKVSTVKRGTPVTFIVGFEFRDSTFHKEGQANRGGRFCNSP